jgi:hypothetical protein
VPNPKDVVIVHSSAINQRGKRSQSSQEAKVERWPVKLDSDGQDDFLVPISTRDMCPWEVKYAVYVMRGKCGHYLGEVGPGNLVGEVVFDASGFRRLRFESSGARSGYKKGHGIPHRETRVTEYALVKGRYQKVREQVDGGACHHCVTNHCTTLQ